MKFKVHTIPHTLFAALHLVRQLKTLGHKAELVREINPKDDDIYIIYNAALATRLPKNYIVYQTEIGTSVWFHEKYLNIIRGAMQVWEYNILNTYRYSDYNRKIFIVGPGIDIQKRTPKDIPVLFYGWVRSCVRRETLLSGISRRMPVKIITNTMGSEMWKLLSRAKVVLNIHFYENSPLELFRIHEALSHHCHVVSEGTFDDQLNYGKYVQFGEGAEILSERLSDCINTDFKLDVSELDNRLQIEAAIAALHQNKSPAFRALNEISRKEKAIRTSM